jgi:phage regulator Rha-like protein
MNMATKSLSQRAIVRVESLILPIRGDKIIIDSDLARIYGVTTRRLNEQVKRNIDRFPRDFMFRLTPREFDVLISQFATSKPGRGGRRKLPYAFTEHGAIMAANVLNSRQAIQMSVYVVRAFVQLRGRLWENRELARKLLELERKVDYQGGELHELFEAFRRLMAVPERPKRQIGFQLKRV